MLTDGWTREPTSARSPATLFNYDRHGLRLKTHAYVVLHLHTRVDPKSRAWRGPMRIRMALRGAVGCGVSASQLRS